MIFNVKLNNDSEKFLERCDVVLQKRIIQKLKMLKETPFIHDAKSIIGNDKQFRIRVGKYRIIYEADSVNNVINIIKIGKRGNVYD